MDQIINKFLLAGDKFMSKLHLKQPGFTYSACRTFTKNKQRIEKFMQTGDTNCIYKNELDKACFQHDMVYGKYKDLQRRIQSDKVLKVLQTIKYTMGMKEARLQWPTRFLIRNQKELVLKLELKKINNKLMNFINQLLGNLKEEKCILLLRTILGVLI